MPAVNVSGPVGRAAAMIRIPSVQKVAKDLKELRVAWNAIEAEQDALRAEDSMHWVKPDIDFTQLDFAMNAVIRAVEADPLHRDTSTNSITAKEVLKAAKAHLGTCVLATVHCPAWLLHWLQSLGYLIITSQRSCNVLYLHTLKGGPQCDCEVLFILNLLAELGFAAGRGTILEKSNAVQWEHVKSRPGAEDITIYVNNYLDARGLKYYGLGLGMIPLKKYSKSPELRRAAVVSAPVTTAGESHDRVDEILNIKLRATLEKMEAMADDIGFFDDEGGGAWLDKLKELD